MKVLCVSVTPSPYQRDLFKALAARPEVDLRVNYLEQAPDDSPWSAVRLEDWERVTPGKVFGKGRVRCHWNSPLPEVEAFDRVILNAPLTAATTQRLFRKLRRSATPWAFWGEELLRRSGARGLVQRFLARPLSGANAVVAIGSRAAADYKRRFPAVPIHDIPYACDLSGFRMAARRRQPASRCRFLFAGQMIERKGVDVLLEAFRRLIEQGTAAELHLVGREGDPHRWRDALPVSERAALVYHGFKQPEELPEIFGSGDVFVLPSRHDGWGVVVNQALGAGLPVITTTAVGAGRDLVEDGRSGIHVPPGEVGPLVEAMRRLALDPGLRSKMATEARRKAEEISPERAAEGWIQVLEQLNPNL